MASLLEQLVRRPRSEREIPAGTIAREDGAVAGLVDGRSTPQPANPTGRWSPVRRPESTWSTQLEMPMTDSAGAPKTIGWWAATYTHDSLSQPQGSATIAAMIRRFQAAKNGRDKGCLQQELLLALDRWPAWNLPCSAGSLNPAAGSVATAAHR